MYILDKKSLIRYIIFVVVLILAIPFDLGRLTGFSNWFSPFLMINSVFVLKSFTILNLVGLLILIIVWFRRRWFCKYLCPIGFLTDIINKHNRISKSRLILNIPNINKWLVLISFGGAIFGFPIFLCLDPMVIFNGFFVPFINTQNYLVLISSAAFLLIMTMQVLLGDLWCERLCPLGGLQLIISDIKNRIYKFYPRPGRIDVGRRLFIGGTMGAVAALILPDFTKEDSEYSILPPGSIERNNFNTLCIRCGSCIKVCPSMILKHENKMGLALLTPVIKFDSGYCLEECNLCSIVCPSGAIKHFYIAEKSRTRIGTAVIDADNCLLMKMKECGICKRACHYNAVSFIDFVNNSILTKPEININNCNGCSACVIICPENCFTINSI